MKLGWVLFVFLALTIDRGAFAMTEESAFSAERRQIISLRLAVLMPAGRPGSPRSRSGVSINGLADVLGTSRAFATMVLSRTDRHLSFDQGRRLSAALSVDVDHVLAADLLDRFATTEALAEATAGDRVPVRELLMHLYARRVERAYGVPAARRRRIKTTKIIEYWRRTMRQRLAASMPGAGSTKEKPRVHLTTMARILGSTTSYVYEMIWGPGFLPVEDGRVLAEALGVPVDRIYAGDVLDQLKTVAEVDAAAANQPAALRLMLLRRYADRVLSCRRELL